MLTEVGPHILSSADASMALRRTESCECSLSRLAVKEFKLS